MDLHKEIKNAYQNIRVPESVTEQLKMELYQKDLHEFHEEESEIFQVEEAPRIPVLKYCTVAAACLVICAGIGFSVSNLFTERSSDRLNPAQSVNVTMTEAEEETTEASAIATARRYGSE